MKDQKNIATINEGFTRDSYSKMISLLCTLSVVVVCLVCALAYMSFFPTKSNYYATTTSGSVVQLHSLSEPVVNDAYLTQWASVAARDAYNINFLDDQDKLDAVEKRFTEAGWTSFKESMQQSGLLKTVAEKKLIMTAIASDDAIIIDRSIQHGHYTWIIQMPMLISFESASQKVSKKTITTVEVIRVPVLQDPLGGIEINSFSVKMI